MYLTAEADRIFRILSESEELADVPVIRAYPYVPKPLRLKTPVLCVSPSGMKVTRASLGGAHFTGEYSVDIDLFCPHSLGTPTAENILETAAALVCTTGVSAVTFGALKNEAAIECFSAKCTVSYHAPVSFSKETLWTAQRN